MPATASGFAYGLGFTGSTGFLHLCGIGTGLAAKRAGSVNLIRYAGRAITVCGVVGLFLAVE